MSLGGDGWQGLYLSVVSYLLRVCATKSTIPRIDTISTLLESGSKVIGEDLLESWTTSFSIAFILIKIKCSGTRLHLERKAC